MKSFYGGGGATHESRLMHDHLQKRLHPLGISLQECLRCQAINSALFDLHNGTGAAWLGRPLRTKPLTLCECKMDPEMPGKYTDSIVKDMFGLKKDVSKEFIINE